MPRYFIKMSYDGTDFHGYQRQPSSTSVQQVVEDSFSTIFRKPHVIVGCGRTDTGVHASCYYFHIDMDYLDEKLLFRLNSLIPNSVYLHSFQEVDSDVHARYDATERSYRFFAHGTRSPFLRTYSSHMMELKKIKLEDLNKTAKTLLNYQEFQPFCKAHADNLTMKCNLTKCVWTYNENSKQFILDVTSDRFLRGMVRLIAGTSVLVAKGDLEIEKLIQALENQERLEKNLSAPAQGLFLTDVVYPFINVEK